MSIDLPELERALPQGALTAPQRSVKAFPVLVFGDEAHGFDPDLETIGW